MKTKRVGVALAAALSVAFATWSATVQAWEPTKTVEFIVPAGQGGGADQMARAAQAIIAKHKLMKEITQTNANVAKVEVATNLGPQRRVV